MSSKAGLEGQAQVDRWADNFDEYGHFIIKPIHVHTHESTIEPSLYSPNGMLLTDLKDWHRQSLPDWHFERMYGEKK